MLCEKCKIHEATVYYASLDTHKPADDPMLQICESCLAEISPAASIVIKDKIAGKKTVSGWTSYDPTSN
jgi:protein-arginine kinase activator protein McsA